MSAYAKPLPQANEHNAPFWGGLKAHQVQLCFCESCNHVGIAGFRWCPACSAATPAWRTVSGEGEIWSWGVFHQVYFEGFRSEAPYNSVIVKLDAGIRLYSSLVDSDQGKIAIGQRVRAVFDDVTDDVTLLKFARTG